MGSAHIEQVAAAQPSSRGKKAALQAAPFVTGCCSGMIATIVVQPVDTLKVRMQLMQKQQLAMSPYSMIRDLAVHRQLLQLYNGLSAGLLRQLVYGSARLGLFTTFEGILQRRAHDRGTTLGFGGRALAGLSAGAAAAIIGNPTEVALIRMQADGTKPLADRAHYKSAMDALRRITRQEGVSTLWAGTAPTVIRAMSTNFGQLAFFSEAKYQLHLHTDLSERGRAGLAAAIGGFAGALISQPFDFIKTRLQNQSLSGSPNLATRYKSTVDCFMTTARHEGISRFYADFWPYFWRVIPQSVITLYLTDHLMAMFKARIHT